MKYNAGQTTDEGPRGDESSRSNGINGHLIKQLCHRDQHQLGVIITIAIIVSFPLKILPGETDSTAEMIRFLKYCDWSTGPMVQVRLTKSYAVI